jgi:hypothetical protein
VKKEIKINIIIYTRIYPPPKAPKTWHDQRVDVFSQV